MQKITYIDYPGKIATIIFTVGCNMRCKYCYNSQFVLLQEMKKNIQKNIKEDDFLKYLDERRNFLEGVVICGGEPTIQQDLPEFIEKIKKMGYAVKLDTNGSNPVLLQNLINKKLIDYIAMDIKDSFDTMTDLTQSHIDLQGQVSKSIEIIANSNIDYEFRTTVSKPYHTAEKIEKIASLLQGKKKYSLQNFFPTDSIIDKKFKAKAFTHNQLVTFQKIAQKYVPTIIRE